MENNSQNIVKSIERIAKSSDAVDDVAPFVSMLFNHIVDKGEREIVIVCFGTNAISGDALGPMVGTLLTQKYDVPAFVYGTDESTVNGKICPGGCLLSKRYTKTQSSLQWTQVSVERIKSVIS